MTISATEPGAARGSNKFTITVIYNGISKQSEVEPNQSVQAVLEAAINQFTVSEARHLLALFDVNGIDVTNEKQSATEAGLTAASRLVLRQSAVKGGRG